MASTSPKNKDVHSTLILGVLFKLKANTRLTKVVYRPDFYSILLKGCFHIKIRSFFGFFCGKSCFFYVLREMLGIGGFLEN